MVLPDIILYKSNKILARVHLVVKANPTRRSAAHTWSSIVAWRQCQCLRIYSKMQAFATEIYVHAWNLKISRRKWPFFILEMHYASIIRTWASICCSLVMRPLYKNGHKTHYASGRTIYVRFFVLRVACTTDDSSSRRIMRLVPVLYWGRITRQTINADIVGRIIRPVFTLDE
jgi:hypothetical protein